MLLVALCLQFVAAYLYWQYVARRVNILGSWLFSGALWLMVLRRGLGFIQGLHPEQDWLLGLNQGLPIIISLLLVIGASHLSHEVLTKELVTKKILKKLRENQRDPVE